MIQLDRVKDGKRNMVTLSYDDGSLHDRRLLKIMNRYGLRGTFHLNSSWVEEEGKVISAEEVKTLYQNQEVSCHGVGHKHLRYLQQQQVIEELLGDRKYLEPICGYPIRGMSYAYGWYSEEVIRTLKSCGFVYARTVESTNRFTLPEDFMQWHPTCHHKQCLERAEAFLKIADKPGTAMFLLYVWGHSSEFAQDDNWDVIENFCQKVGGREDIWYATNIEIYEYMMARNSLVISADQTMVYNPSALSVWFTADGKECKVGPGELFRLN